MPWVERIRVVMGGAAPLVVAGFTMLATGSAAQMGPPRPVPMLAVAPDLKDFGEVGRDAGRLEAAFTLRNEGRVPLRILKITPT